MSHYQVWYLFTSGNHKFKFRRVRSAFPPWEPSKTSVMWFTQHFGMWLLQPEVNMHILRDSGSWCSGCLFNKNWEVWRLDAVLVSLASCVFFFLETTALYLLCGYGNKGHFFLIWSSSPVIVDWPPGQAPFSTPMTECGSYITADPFLYWPALAQGFSLDYTAI